MGFIILFYEETVIFLCKEVNFIQKRNAKKCNMFNKKCK